MGAWVGECVSVFIQANLTLNLHLHGLHTKKRNRHIHITIKTIQIHLYLYIYKIHEWKLTLEELFVHAPTSCNISYPTEPKWKKKKKNNLWLETQCNPFKKEENIKASSIFVVAYLMDLNAKFPCTSINMFRIKL